MAAERKPEYFAGKGLQIGIIGCGDVGLPLALRFADVGQQVTGFDLDKFKVDKLNAGESYIQHISGGEDSRARASETVVRDEQISRKLRGNGRGADLRANSPE